MLFPVADACQVASATGNLRFTPRPCSAHRPYDILCRS